MQHWKTLSRQPLCQPNAFCAVELHQVELPGGQVIPDWPWVITPEFVNVVAEGEDGRWLCFRQFKYAVQGVSLGPVGGYLEPREDPEAAARRELREETGCTAASWTSLGSYVVDSNRGAGRAHFFLARGARRTAVPTGGDLEEQELLWLSRAELEAALDGGQVKVLPWAAAIALALRRAR